MYEAGAEIVIAGTPYNMVFNTAAFKEFFARYKSVEGFSQTIEREPERAVEEYVWLITLLVNQGIQIDNYYKGEKTKPVTEDFVAMVMKPKEISAKAEALMAVIVEGMTDGSGEDTEIDEVLQEVEARKNGTGAEGV